MKHFDVEAYAKTMLYSRVVVPEDNVWQQISEKIDQSRHQRHRNAQYVKIALFMVFLLAMPGRTEKNDDRTSVVQNYGAVEAIDKLFEHSQSNNGVTEAIPGSRIADTEIKRYQREKPQKALKRQVRLAFINRAETHRPQKEDMQKTQKNLKGSEMSNHLAVTDAEVDSLMEKARQNIERERALQKEREAFTHEMLADIEKEIETTRNQGFYYDIKQGYAKLKTVISN